MQYASIKKFQLCVFSKIYEKNLPFEFKSKNNVSRCLMRVKLPQVVY